MRVTEIDWVGNKNLPTEVDVPDDYNASEIYDLLVEKYHCDISCYCMHTERSINYIFPCPSEEQDKKGFIHQEQPNEDYFEGLNDYLDGTMII